MRYFPAFLLLIILSPGCQHDLTFKSEKYEKSADANCDKPCPKVSITVPIANDGGIVSDSINNKIFAVCKEIVYFGEKQYDADSYDELTSSFIESYDKMKAEFPEDTFGWSGEVTGTIGYKSDKIINIVIESYMFTGGAHGYSGTRSLIFDAETGKIIPIADLFSDNAAFTKLAEQRFREKFEIPVSEPINSQGLMFENDLFTLPQNIIVQKDGLLLLYNTYEIASYSDGPQQVFIPFSESENMLAFK